MNVSTAPFRNVFHTHFKNGLYVIVRKRVQHGFSVSAAADQPGMAQDPQLMRDRGLRHTKHVCNVRDRSFSSRQRVQDPASGAVPENLEKLRKITERVLVGHTCRLFFFLYHRTFLRR